MTEPNLTPNLTTPNLTIVKRILRNAEKLIEKGWTNKGYSATTARGTPTYNADKDAKKFCAIGAICRAAQRSMDERNVAISYLYRSLPKGHFEIVTFNDQQKTRRPVIQLFERAIEAVETDAKMLKMFEREANKS